MQVDDKTALQAALDAVFQILDLSRRAVSGNDDLLVLVDQRVERVEEFFLGAVLAGDELHVVDHQHVDRAEQLLEAHDLAFAKRLHEAVHELLGREVKHPKLGVPGLKLVRDGVHQMGLAQPDTTIKEQRVERDRPTFCHAPGSGMGKLVRFAHDKAVKRETGIESGALEFVVMSRPRFGDGAVLGGAGDAIFLTCRSHQELDPVDLFAKAVQLAANLVRIIARHPIPEKHRRHFETGDPGLDSGHSKRFDPRQEIVLADPLKKIVADESPCVIGHYCLPVQSRCPCIARVCCHPQSPAMHDQPDFGRAAALPLAILAESTHSDRTARFGSGGTVSSFMDMTVPCPGRGLSQDPVLDGRKAPLPRTFQMVDPKRFS